MKALHAGLLVIGAAVAGGVAVRLTEPPPIAVTIPAAQQTPQTIPRAEPQPLPAATPPPPPATRWRLAEPPVASAPPPVYTQPQPLAAPPRYTRSNPKPSPVPQVAATPLPASPAVVPKPEPYREPPAAPQPKPDPARHVTLESGSSVSVRTAQPLSAGQVSVGDLFNGVLTEPLVADGLIVGERGAHVSGRVIAINRQALTLRLLNFQTADGQRIEISTEPVTILGGNALSFRLAARVTITERRI